MKTLILFILALLFAFPLFAEKTEWTYAFYLASGDGLYIEQNNNFLEICEGAGHVKNGKVIVFIDVEPDKRKISRLKLEKGTYAFEAENCSELKPVFIPEIGLIKNADLDSSDTGVIGGFFDYVKTNYPSRKYFFSISAHGDPLVSPKPGRMRPANIAKAVKKSRPDILALDMCYAGTLASLWELRNSANILIASGTTIPITLNDYSLFLKKAGAGPSSPADTSADFIETYKYTYAEKRFPVSVFALETGDRFDNFVELFSKRAECFPKKIDRFSKIKSPQSSKTTLYGTNTDLLSALNVINRMLEHKFKPVIISSFSINSDFTGPSLFLPMDDTAYKKLRDTYRKTSLGEEKPEWPDFLDNLYNYK